MAQDSVGQRATAKSLQLAAGAPAWLPRADRLMLGAAVLLSVCAIGFLIGLSGLNAQHDTVMEQAARSRFARAAANGFMQASIDAETGQRGFLLTNDAQFLEPYENGRANVRRHINRLQALSEELPVLAPKVAHASTLSEQALEDLATTLAARRTGRLSQTDLRARLVRSKTVMDALRNDVNDILRDVELLAEAARDAESTTRDRTYLVGGGLAILTLLATLLTLWALYLERRGWRLALDALERANIAAEEARAAAAASDMIKTRFLAAASHDMRQPLHALTLYLSALDRRVQTDEARDILAKAERATQSMVGMFGVLLDLSRIQANVMNVEKVDFLLQDVFDRIVGEHPDRDVSAAPAPFYIRTDPVLLERILRNLVSNALKHGGGSARLAAHAVGGKVEMSVSDSGPGIPVEDHARVFDEFVRLDGRATEGLGVGLAIVQRVAKMLGLELELRSARGEGATFILRGPAVARPTVAARSRASASLSGLDVLVMDDDGPALEAMSGALRDLGA